MAWPLALSSTLPSPVDQYGRYLGAVYMTDGALAADSARPSPVWGRWRASALSSPGPWPHGEGGLVVWSVATAMVGWSSEASPGSEPMATPGATARAAAGFFAVNGTCGVTSLVGTGGPRGARRLLTLT